MRGKEQERVHPETDFQMPGEISLRVPGLLPDVYGRNNRLVEKGNLEEKGEEIIDSIRREKKVRAFAQLRRAIQLGDKEAVLIVTAGIITVIIGAELGIRHGRDFQYVLDIVRGRKQK